MICMLGGSKMDGRIFYRRLSGIRDGHHGGNKMCLRYIKIKNHVVIEANVKTLCDLLGDPVEGAFAAHESRLTTGCASVRDQKAVSQPRKLDPGRSRTDWGHCHSGRTVAGFVSPPRDGL
jgi:hypothetical protein